MTLNLECNQIPILLHILQGHLPEATIIYYTLKRIWKQEATGYVLVDQLPALKAVLVIERHVRCQNAEKSVSSAYMYTLGDVDFKSFLDSSRIQGPGFWHIYFLGKHNEEWNFLKKRFFSELRLWWPGDVSYADGSYADGGSMYFATKIDYSGSLPDGFTKTKLTKDDSKTVAQNWLPLSDACSYVTECIQMADVNICVVNEQQELVAWTLRQFHGTIGMTFVQPKYRNRGLGKYVTALAAREVIERERFCTVIITDDNVASSKMHKALGFKEMQVKMFFSYLLND